MCKDDREPTHKNSIPQTRFTQGWIIEGRCADDGHPTGRFLQIGTGQWCPKEYATVFPLQNTATVYACEFGYRVGHNANVVRFSEFE